MSGFIVEFMQENLPQIAWLIEENSGKARLLLPNRREMNIPSTRLLPWQGPSYASYKNKDEIIALLQEHKDKREDIEKDIDIISIWEMTQGEVQAESPTFFAELIFSEANIDIVCAYAHALLKHKTHFKFQNPNFEVYTKEIVDAKLEAQNSAKEKEELLGIAANFFHLLWELHKKNSVYTQIKNMEEKTKTLQNFENNTLSTQNEELLKNLLFQRIRDPESHDNSAFWKQITKQLPDDPHLALLLATAWGIVPYHYNYLLYKADYDPAPLFDDWPHEKEEEIQNIIQTFQHIEDTDKTINLRNYTFDNIANPSSFDNLNNESDNCILSNADLLSQFQNTQINEEEKKEEGKNFSQNLEKKEEQNKKESSKNTSLNLSALTGLGSFANLATPYKNKQNSNKKNAQQQVQKNIVACNKIFTNKETNKEQGQSSLQNKADNKINTLNFSTHATSTKHISEQILSPIFSEFSQSIGAKSIQTQNIHDYFKPFLERDFISIDSATTKDIDDAFTVTRNENGDYEIFIALACPACIWEFNSPFDKQILQRSTSLYLPEATYHMMPHTLSTELFSLKEMKVRPALICNCRVSANGEILESTFDFMRVKVRNNLQYDACEWLLTKENEEQEAHNCEQTFIKHDTSLETPDMANTLHSAENESMEFLAHMEKMENFDENELQQNSTKKEHKQELNPTQNTSINTTFSHSTSHSSSHESVFAPPSELALANAKLHEECLKHAHEFAKARLLYRISKGSVIIEKEDMHIRLETPDMPKSSQEQFETIEQHLSNKQESKQGYFNKNTQVFIDYVPQNPCAQLIVSELMILANTSLAHFAKNQNIPLFFRTQDLALPKEYAGVWNKPEDITKIARSMSAAKTSTVARPHAGLGLQAYSPVTSPLRRYADLVNEAQLLRYLFMHFYQNNTEQPLLEREAEQRRQISQESLLWNKKTLDELLFTFNMHNEAVTQVQRMRPRYWRFVAIEQEAKRQNDNSKKLEHCGFHATISDENDAYVTVTLTREQLIVRGKRHLFGDKVLLGQKVFVRLGKINPLRGEMSILAIQEC